MTTIPRTGRILATVVLFTMPALIGCFPAPKEPAAAKVSTAAIPQDQFARVNGVQLHYLDWGGTGDLLLFVHGLGQTAHAWDEIAPAFTDRYRVMATTRRSHGASEKTDAGLDLDTLAADIRGFIAATGAKRVILVGHSFAGLEMPLVAAREPKVAGIVFVDAVYDWAFLRDSTTPLEGAQRYYAVPDSALASATALERWNERRFPSDWGPAMAATLKSQTYLQQDGRLAWQLTPERQGRIGKLGADGADYTGVRVPVLAIWANQAATAVANMKSYGFTNADTDAIRAWLTAVDVRAKQRGIESLTRSVPAAKIVEFDGPHTLPFASAPEMIRLIDQFLKEQLPPAP